MSSNDNSSQEPLSPLKRALAELRRLRGKLDEIDRREKEPIAIVGFGLRFPGGAFDEFSLWQILAQGVNTVTETPRDRWNLDDYYDPDPDKPGKMYTRHGAYLSGVDRFDAEFFGISPREAASMDPQHRLLLEISWEALENAAIAPATLRDSQTGVFVGIGNSDYWRMVYADEERVDAYSALGNSYSVAAGRLAYFFGLHGPAMAIDTACSSSLVAVHQACRSLRAAECNLALAAGVNLILSPEPNINFSKSRMLARDGRCKTFDASADGYVRGEGCGVIVLKTLSSAKAEGNRVLAVIRGSAVNQDGRSGGLTAPNGPAQEAVIREALATAGVAPHEISYLEAHGTGTSLGDPIEVRAACAVLCQDRSADRPLAIGSVKTNIGHLEAAAGVAGLLKVILALQHKSIPAHLHLNKKNPYMDWDRWPISVPTSLTPWNPVNGKRIAGVSSFGFSGTNAHLIVEEAPEVVTPSVSMDRPVHILALSARNQQGLQQLANAVADRLEAVTEKELADVCFTASTGRSHFPERLAIVGEHAHQIRDGLLEYSNQKENSRIPVDESIDLKSPPVAFLFTGQGSQYVGMGRDLYETSPTFRRILNRSDEILREYLEKPLLSILYPESTERSLIDATAYCQPALFVIGYALAELWRSWGIRPAIVMGHSVGEYTAACIAGAFGFEDALRLVAERGRLMQSLPAGGRMAAVFTRLQAVEAAIISTGTRSVSVAAINGPELVVISGQGQAVQAVLDRLWSAGVKSSDLAVSHAFHSPLMYPIADAFARAAETVQYGQLNTSFVSTVTGLITDTKLIAAPDYWRGQMIQPVQFMAAIQTIEQQGVKTLLELGPSPVLLGMSRRCLGTEVTCLPSLRPGRGDWLQMLESLRALYLGGAEIDWAGFERDYCRRGLALPTYPFQRERYFIERSAKKIGRPEAAPGLHPLAARRVSSPSLKDIVFESEISATSHPFLEDLRVFGRIIFPATAYVETVRAAATLGLEKNIWAIEDLVIGEALALEDSETKRLQVVLSRHQDDTVRFEMFSSRVIGLGAENSWRLHASGNLIVRDNQASAPIDLGAFRRDAEEFGPERFYANYQRRGIGFGPRFRGVTRVWRRPGQALGLIEATLLVSREANEYSIHPALLDACIQVIAGAVDEMEADPRPFMPVGIESIRTFGEASGKLWSVASVQGNPSNQEAIKAQFQIADERGRLVAEIRGMSFKRIDRAAVERAIQGKVDDWLYETVWVPLARFETVASEPAATLRRDENHNSENSMRHQSSLPLSAQPRRWLILGDRAGIGQRLADFFRMRGDHAALACVEGDVISDRSNGDENLGLIRQNGLDKLVDRYFAHGDAPLDGVIYLWPLEAKTERSTEPGCEHETEFYCGAALQLIQALVRYALTQPPRLWLCTRGAHRVDPGDRAVSPAGAAVWGLGKAVGLEHPEFNCVRLDLDPSGTTATESLAAALDLEPAENEIAIRSGRQLSPRLQRLRKAGDLTIDPGTWLGGRPYRLTFSSRGSLENLKLDSMERRRPGPGEVEIRVHATALNFRDVMNVMGMYPGDPGPLGAECAGEIVALGHGVTKFALGDSVVALALGSFGAYVTTPAALVVPKPARVSFEAAVTLPVAYVTAYYTLHHLGKLKRGDTVLIHAGAGGVGIAAVTLAKRAGAEIFATAGSPEKRAFLKSMGVAHVLDSRSLDFAGQILELTNGRGVDVVLNSLADQFVDHSLQVTARNGRFLEIGKRGIWEPERVSSLDRGIQYHIVDWSVDARDNPELVGSMLRELMAAVDQDELAPLPHRVFSLRESEAAFRFMAQGRHIGKIVLSHIETLRSKTGFSLDADGTYLITGGFRGVGLMAAQWLADRGARHLVLTGRRAPELGNSTLQAIQACGVQLHCVQADISDEKAMARILENLRETMPPLRGVIHSAGVLDDGVLLQQNWERFATVFAPKVAGSLVLHRLTASDPLDFCVFFSSLASVFGSPGQGSYAAANAFMDGLAQARNAGGKPTVSVNWGAWAGAGMAVDRGLISRAQDLGYGVLEPGAGFQALEAVLTTGQPQVMVSPIDWSTFLKRSQAGGHSPGFLDEFSRSAPLADRSRERRALAEKKPATPESDFTRKLQSATPGRRRDLLIAHLRFLVANVLGFDPSREIDPEQSFFELGMDSLMSLEFKGRLERTLALQLPSTLTFNYPNIKALTDYILCDALKFASESKAEISELRIDPENPSSEQPVDDLSEDEIAHLLQKKLEEIK